MDLARNVGLPVAGCCHACDGAQALFLLIPFNDYCYRILNNVFRLYFLDLYYQQVLYLFQYEESLEEEDGEVSSLGVPFQSDQVPNKSDLSSSVSLNSDRGSAGEYSSSSGSTYSSSSSTKYSSTYNRIETTESRKSSSYSSSYNSMDSGDDGGQLHAAAGSRRTAPPAGHAERIRVRRSAEPRIEPDYIRDEASGRTSRSASIFIVIHIFIYLFLSIFINSFSV